MIFCVVFLIFLRSYFDESVFLISTAFVNLYKLSNNFYLIKNYWYDVTEWSGSSD